LRYAALMSFAARPIACGCLLCRSNSSVNAWSVALPLPSVREEYTALDQIRERRQVVVPLSQAYLIYPACVNSAKSSW
jgi:hypothetical protein